jgi:N-methylhydantoinase B
MSHEPVDRRTVKSERSADLRFVGQLFELNIELGPESDALPSSDHIEAKFRSAYQQTFGIDLPNLKVQLVNVRLTAMAVLSEPRPTQLAQGVALLDVPPHRRQNYLSADGSQTPLPVYRLTDCRGAQLSGPALIEHAGSTVWIDSAQSITIHANGSIQIGLLAALQAKPTAPAAASLLETDPVTFEVVKSAFYAICDEMKSVIMRTSFSPLLSLSADLSCVLLDTQARVIAQGVDIPVHLGAASFTGRFALEAFALSTWREGDGVLLNDPYAGGTHLPDVSLLTPVFFAETLMGFVLSRIHWPDIGGIAPGSSSVCDDIIKEGLRIPPLKIIEQGVVREDVLRLILANVRVPQDRMGDFQAARAGHQRATERMLELCHRYGAQTVGTVMHDTLVYSQKRVAAQLLSLPDADVSNQESLDGDGIDPNAAPIIKVRITKTGAHLKFDFTGSAPCVQGPINAPLPVTCAAIYYTLLSFVGGQIAPNAGVYANVEVITEPGTIVHASYPFPVVAANTETANRLVDILMGALAQAYPEKVSAGGYGSACVYTLGGTDPTSQKAFVHYETIGGGMGGTASNAGPSGLRVHMGNTMNLPIEGVEAALPVLFHEYAIARHLSGQGMYPGGGGVRKIIEVLTDGVQTSVLGERTKTPARGVAGGGDGGLASFTLVSDGVDRPLDSKSGPHRLKRGDKLVMVTAGGGAWGPSTLRKS